MKFNKAILLTALTAYAEAFDLLKDYSNGFRIGVATNTMHYNNGNYVNAMKAFNYMVAENACKFVSIQGTKGRYNFNDCDNHLKKAKELGMDFRGHALIWHSMAPNWVQHEDSQTMRKSIVDHITNVLNHYKGKIDTWDVVNEAIDDSSNGNGWKFRNSFLYQKNKDFIDLSFKTAREVDPNVKLFYNDYNTEGIYGKSESVYQFVADMKKRNIPIDGVGIQYHVSVQNQPQLNKITDLIGRYCKLGLEVHITELDVSCQGACNSGDEQNKQGQVFSNALKACLSNTCCTGFLVWGVGDPDSWLGKDKKGLLFDGSYKPKAQYNALLNVLKTTKAASLSNKSSGGNSSSNSSSGNSSNSNKSNGNSNSSSNSNSKNNGNNSSSSNKNNNGNSSSNKSNGNSGSCWSKSLGYSCCKSCRTVYKDASGKWGIENNQWCGIPETCTSKCVGADGYPCCERTCIVYAQDNSGKWSVENKEWCLIDTSVCRYV